MPQVSLDLGCMKKLYFLQLSLYSEGLGRMTQKNRGWCFITGKVFSLLYGVQTGSGVHLASYTMGTGDFISGSKAAGQQVDQSPSTSDVCLNRLNTVFNTPIITFSIQEANIRPTPRVYIYIPYGSHNKLRVFHP
jgi:hypothetical protein